MWSHPDPIRKLWTRVMLRGVQYRDRHRQIEALYRFSDPWNLTDPKETFRFEETNRLISREFGHVGRLFEIGCGEGHQSLHLAEICDRLSGCDVSATAIERARLRFPDGDFTTGPFNVKTAGERQSYDLVIACEALYYMNDVRAALSLMSRVGKACLVTFYKDESARLEPILDEMGIQQRLKITTGDDWWTAAWWRNTGQGSPNH